MNRPRFVSEDGLIIECQLDIHEAADTLRHRMGHLWSLSSRLLEKTVCISCGRARLRPSRGFPAAVAKTDEPLQSNSQQLSCGLTEPHAAARTECTDRIDRLHLFGYIVYRCIT